jgi:hypothetical protein
MRFAVAVLTAAALGLISRPVAAEPLSIKAVMSPKEQIRADLPTGQPHFVLFVRREGKATGAGVLDGAELTEYGMHDIRPGVDGSPRGYLVARLTRWRPSGDPVEGPGDVRSRTGR